MSRRFVVVLAVLTACVSSGRYRTLEKRVAELEERETQRQLELNGTLLRLEAQLAALAANLGRLTDLGVEDLYDKLVKLEERIEKVGAARPPSRPSRPQPDPMAVYAVAVTGYPSRGAPDALVTIVRAGEYACPFCEKVRPTLDQLLLDYPDEVRVVYKDFVVHPQTATEPALAGCAANRQGKFWAMDELLWEKAFKARSFGAAHLETLAREARLDLRTYKRDVQGACKDELAEDMRLLTGLGVGATPTFFINGRTFTGAQPLGAFKAIIDEELTLARTRIRNGASAATYYDDWIIARGADRLVPVPTP